MISDIIIARKLLSLASNAKERGLEFSLSFKTVKRLLSSKKCFYTGVPFQGDGPMARSIDRIDTSLGYIEGNVVACTISINSKKANLTIQEVIMLSSKLKKYQKSRKSISIL